ncbi:MAG TPA: TenA family protein [Dongiaceae bacterium]|nr:TenA family protein [Dongiaceae bacterium]
MIRPPLSDEILTQTRDIWDAMQSHRFVRDIEDDQLDPAVFRRYLAYENAFVETAILIFGYSLVKAPGLEEQRWLIGVLRALSEQQIPYFRRAFDNLDMPEREWRDIALPPTVAAFRDGMLAMAAHGPYLDGITAMFAADWMYWTWCKRAAGRTISDPVLRRWVDLHAAEEFADQAWWLRQQIDLFGAELGPRSRSRLTGIFRRAIELEIDFHTAPYE